MTCVRCHNPQCKWSKGLHTIQLEPDFDDWPTDCPKCNQEKLRPVVSCPNTKCRKWVVPRVLEDGSRFCPKCGSRM